MKRGVGAQWFDGGDLSTVDLWVERTDAAEIQIRIIRDGHADVDLYLTTGEAAELNGLLTDARNERWRRS